MINRSLLILLAFSSASAAQDLSPQDALRRMKVADGFEITLVASEPDVRQPLTMSFDERGRIWVIQYLQYPNPAGLTPVKVDEYLRTTYDRLPEPPPRGPKGADKITILEDKDGDGRYETTRDFVTGLNLASGMCLGHGGVYIVQPPYLLFYPDRNGDDAPDGDPEVLLTGFGQEDSHAYANSLQWGPDGWLYGTQGSTVTANIRGIGFQQGIWRYHPITREFELFAEGGGNTWGLDFDRHGNVIAGTNWGGFAMLHQVQGAYYIKGFGKHGPLHNPHTYGYFEHVPHGSFKGGHVTIGGIVYQGGAFPSKFDNMYIAGNVLSNDLYWHVIEPKGSSFTNRFGGEFLVSGDPWFRPVDCFVGPDGALYVVDWHDKRANHVDPRDNWDRTNGRIYRIQAKGAPAAARPSLAKVSSAELADLLGHRNDWYRREARRILAERRDPEVLPMLRQKLSDSANRNSVQALWALYVTGGFNEEQALELLSHPHEEVRAWAIRLQGDTRRMGSAFRERLLELARSEPSPMVRNQMACTAKRLPAGDALALTRVLLHRAEDVDDPQIPLLLWWAIEDKAISDRDLVVGLLDRPDAWTSPIVHKHIVERIARRYMAEGGSTDHATCARLLAAAPGPESLNKLIQGMEKALEGRRLDRIPAALEKPIADLLKAQPSHPTLLNFAIRLGSEEAYATALKRLDTVKVPDGEASSLVTLLGQVGKPDCVPVLLKLLAESSGTSTRTAVLAALQTFQDPSITPAVLDAYARLPAALKLRALWFLTARPASAMELLKSVDRGVISPKEVPLDQLQRLMGHNDPALSKLVEKHWGKVGAATPGEKIAQIRSIRHILNQGKGDAARGKAHYQKLCAPCHRLFGEGNKIGPELDGADRKNLEVLVMNLVDPSAIIRPEYQAHQIRTTDGQVLTGLLADQTPQAVTLVDAQNARTVIARSKIDALKAATLSLMPEKIIDPLDDHQMRDLFAYLRADGPVAGAPQGDTLPGTAALQSDKDLASEMVDGIDRFLLREIEASVARRATSWKRDTSSAEAYIKSIEPNRERFRKIIGAVDARVNPPNLQYLATPSQPALVGTGAGFEAYAVRWSVFRGVEGEGLLLAPTGRKPVADVVAIPEADQSAEQIAGLLPGVPPHDQFARRLAENGCRVIIPTIIDRADTYSISSVPRATNQPHREFVYRPAFEMGRHIIGYEVQKILAAVDWFQQEAAGAHPRIGVFGYGEGGLLALYAGAVDPRINVTCVSGYFGPRQGAWAEPIYRNVQSLLKEFGDAEIASLIAPRSLLVEHGDVTPVAGPPAPRQGRGGAAPGAWQSPSSEVMLKEWERAWGMVKKLNPNDWVANGLTGPGQQVTLRRFLGAPPTEPGEAPKHLRKDFDPQKRLKRQFDQLIDDTQVLLRESENVRKKLWAKADKKSVADWERTTEAYRDHFYNTVIGRFDLPLAAPNVRTRKLYDEPKYTGYEVVLDVFPDVFAYGILLLPKDLKPGDRRPVVVCQHGLEGRPQDVADPKRNVPAYDQYACKLADRGFVVYAPQNPYIFRDRFRTLQRKLNLLDKTLFSIIIPQHHVTIEWLAQQPFVDPERIAFYGLSYGGKTAMRVPSVLKRYCLSICSADFNEWIWKNASTASPYSYVTTGEYEIFEWDLGNTYNYAEMAALIAPRPFMVERGHSDGVAPDEMVAYEYAKVRRVYAELRIPERTEIEFFNGPHKINGVGTFEFLHRHLKWPKPN